MIQHPVRTARKVICSGFQGSCHTPPLLRLFRVRLEDQVLTSLSVDQSLPYLWVGFCGPEGVEPELHVSFFHGLCCCEVEPKKSQEKNCQSVITQMGPHKPYRPCLSQFTITLNPKP